VEENRGSVYHCKLNRRDFVLFGKQDCFQLNFPTNLCMFHDIIACYMPCQFNCNLRQANHTSVRERCKLTKIIICSLYVVLNSVVLNSSSVDKECFNLMLVLTEWVSHFYFNLLMEAESAAETSCFIKIRNCNIPVFVKANNKTLSCIFRLDNFFV
jgi:hypothetical protein